MVDHAAENNGLPDFVTLKDHYEGVGVQAVNARQADKVLNDFFIQVRRNYRCGGTNLRGR